MLRTITLMLLAVTFAQAKDKEKEVTKPTFTTEQKVEALKRQRTLLAAMTRQAAANATVEMLSADVASYGQGICGDVTKFKFNPETVDCDVVPEVKDESKPNVPPPATPAPAVK